MTLGQKQRKFTSMIAQLIQYADSIGYGLTFGDAYRDPRLHGDFGTKRAYGEAFSCHKVRLAVDFNLFIDEIYQTTTEAYTPLGEYWESIGGSWGGRFNDGNHFSLEYQGKK